MEQTEAVEHRISWTEEEPQWLISVWIHLQREHSPTYPHVEHTAGVRQRVAVRLLQVLAGGGHVEGHAHHLQVQLLGRLQQVPTAFQGEAKGHAGLGRMGLCGQLQQQPKRGQAVRW